MKEILERRSVRSYTDKEISDETVKELLKAAMAAPSAGNEQPWEFIVIRDPQIFQDIMDIHPYAQPLKEAQVAILVCGDITKEKYQGYWVQDCSAATQNILIKVENLGLGAVWLGVYPTDDRVKGIKEMFNLPDTVIPLSIVSVGYPAKKPGPANRYDESKIHMNRF